MAKKLKVKISDLIDIKTAGGITGNELFPYSVLVNSNLGAWESHNAVLYDIAQHVSETYDLDGIADDIAYLTTYTTKIKTYADNEYPKISSKRSDLVSHADSTFTKITNDYASVQTAYNSLHSYITNQFGAFKLTHESVGNVGNKIGIVWSNKATYVYIPASTNTSVGTTTTSFIGSFASNNVSLPKAGTTTYGSVSLGEIKSKARSISHKINLSTSAASESVKMSYNVDGSYSGTTINSIQLAAIGTYGITNLNNLTTIAGNYTRQATYKGTYIINEGITNIYEDSKHTESSYGLISYNQIALYAAQTPPSMTWQWVNGSSFGAVYVSTNGVLSSPGAYMPLASGNAYGLVKYDNIVDSILRDINSRTNSIPIADDDEPGAIAVEQIQNIAEKASHVAKMNIEDENLQFYLGFYDDSGNIQNMVDCPKPYSSVKLEHATMFSPGTTTLTRITNIMSDNTTGAVNSKYISNVNSTIVGGPEFAELILYGIYNNGTAFISGKSSSDTFPKAEGSTRGVVNYNDVKANISSVINNWVGESDNTKTITITVLNSVSDRGVSGAAIKLPDGQTIYTNSYGTASTTINIKYLSPSYSFTVSCSHYQSKTISLSNSTIQNYSVSLVLIDTFTNITVYYPTDKKTGKPILSPVTITSPDNQIRTLYNSNEVAIFTISDGYLDGRWLFTFDANGYMLTDAVASKSNINVTCQMDCFYYQTTHELRLFCNSTSMSTTNPLPSGIAITATFVGVQKTIKTVNNANPSSAMWSADEINRWCVDNQLVGGKSFYDYGSPLSISLTDNEYEITNTKQGTETINNIQFISTNDLEESISRSFEVKKKDEFNNLSKPIKVYVYDSWLGTAISGATLNGVLIGSNKTDITGWISTSLVVKNDGTTHTIYVNKDDYIQGSFKVSKATPDNTEFRIGLIPSVGTKEIGIRLQGLDRNREYIVKLTEKAGTTSIGSPYRVKTSSIIQGTLGTIYNGWFTRTATSTQQHDYDVVISSADNENGVLYRIQLAGARPGQWYDAFV